jgi:hypothetical protein
MLTPVPTKRWARASVARPTASPEDPDASPPALLAEALRQTTLRAHQAINRTPHNVRVLRDLAFEIVALEDQAERMGLRGLRPFLRSLRLRVEATL